MPPARSCGLQQNPPVLTQVVLYNGHKMAVAVMISSSGNTDVCRYSPLHTLCHVKTHCAEYPATLLLTGDHDDRVVPLHSLKFIAELQHVLGNCHHQVSAVIAASRFRLTGLVSVVVLIHGQVTIIFVVSVGLSVCLFVQSFAQPSSIRFGSSK